MARVHPTDQIESGAPSLQAVPAIFPEPAPKELSLYEKEPAQVNGALAAVVAAASVLAMKFFHFELDAQTQLAIVTLLAVLGPIVAGIVTRAKVIPVAKFRA